MSGKNRLLRKTNQQVGSLSFTSSNPGVVEFLFSERTRIIVWGDQILQQ